MRAFIVGNGPSLNDTPLELLEGEVSYGINAIHFIYPQTTWRPTNVVIGDLDRAHSAWWWEINNKKFPWSSTDERVNRFVDIISENKGARIHIRGVYQTWAKRLIRERFVCDSVDYFSVCTHHSLGKGWAIEEGMPDGWHFPQVCRWGGGVLMALQLAVQKGYKPLYMVGCDLGYKPGGDNHFSDDYTEEVIDAEKAAALNKVIGNAHEQASDQWEIYNAGAGGTLEAYERVELKELFDV